MSTGTCTDCGNEFYKTRNTKRCPDCREKARYGTKFQQTRKDTLDTAYGQPCARCGRIMREGMPLDLDHMPDGTLKWSHASCNRASGASAGNRARAAAYRRETGRPTVPAQEVAPKSGGVMCHCDKFPEPHIRYTIGSRCW